MPRVLESVSEKVLRVPNETSAESIRRMRAASMSRSAAATLVSRCRPIEMSRPCEMRALDTVGAGPVAARVATLVEAPQALINPAAATQMIRCLLTTRSYERAAALASAPGRT